MYTGPHIASEGLVFGYDTGYGLVDNQTTYRFNKGEPTENLSLENGVIDWTSLDLGAASITRSTIVANEKYRFTSTVGGGLRILFNLSKLTNNLPYNLSYKYNIISGSSFVLNDWCDQSMVKIHKDYDTYKYSSGYGTRATYDNTYRFADIIMSDNTIVDIWDIQLEQKTHATPFTKTSRSVSGSLINLSKQGTVNLVGAQYDTEGMLLFDPITLHDPIDTNFGNGIDPTVTHFTVEAIVKSNVTEQGKMWMDTEGQGTNQRFYSAINTSETIGMGIQGSSWNNAVGLDIEFHHQVITMDGSQSKAYDNGELIVTKNYTSYTFVNNIHFGGRSSYPWKGYIHIAKIYNRVLTPEEIKQNFQSYKTRFGM